MAYDGDALCAGPVLFGAEGAPFNRLDPEQADRFFAVVAASVLDRVLREDLNTRDLVPALRAVRIDPARALTRD